MLTVWYIYIQELNTSIVVDLFVIASRFVLVHQLKLMSKFGKTMGIRKHGMFYMELFIVL